MLWAPSMHDACTIYAPGMHKACTSHAPGIAKSAPGIGLTEGERRETNPGDAFQANSDHGREAHAGRAGAATRAPVRNFSPQGTLREFLPSLD